LVVNRLTDVLAAYEPTLGIAVYPRDGENSEALLGRAKSPRKKPLLDFTAFQRRKKSG
jgi:hypothetical protein